MSFVANLLRSLGPNEVSPATPVLSQPVDNGDGTGASAVVSGSATGATNTVYTAPWAGPGSSLIWTASSTRTGDGAVALALSDGFYVARCESVLAGLPSLPSNEPLFQVTGGAAYLSVHKALAAAVQATIQGMLGTSIVGISPASVHVRKVPYLGDVSAVNPLPSTDEYALPAIVICYFDVEEIVPTEGSNVRDDIGYPISVVFLNENESANVPEEANDDPFLRWREVVIAKFNHLRGFGTTPGYGGYLTVTANGNSYSFHDCRVKPGTIFDYEKLAKKKLDFGWLKLSFILRRMGGTV